LQTDTHQDELARADQAELIESEDIRVLSDPYEIRQRYLGLIESAKSEISLIIATPNALRRNLTGGMIDRLREAATKRNVKVNLVIPAEEDQIYAATDTFERIGQMPKIENFRAKRILPMTRQIHRIKSTFLIIDKVISFIIDVKDDTQNTLVEAAGYATY
jgi:hypothetical protein